MPVSTNFFARLGIPRDATAEEIRAAYFEAARKLHPDTSQEPDAQEQFLLVQEAYDVLSNPERRNEYESTLPPAEIAAPAIASSVQYSRSCVPLMPEGQLMYVMLEFTSIPDPIVTSNPPLNLCLVLDKSTSMQGNRMDVVKANAIQLLRQMRAQDIISVVVFSDRAEVLIPATRIADLIKIENRISMIQTGGGTEILSGLEAGIGQIMRHQNASYINHIILLTDGRTYGDEDACLELGRQAATQGIGISGIGIGHEWNDAFIDELTRSSGGSSMYISAPKELHSYLQQKYASLGRVYAERVTLDFSTDPNVELRTAFRIQPDATPLANKSPIIAGNIQQFNSLSVLLEFFVKPLDVTIDEITLARGSVRMDIPSRSVPAIKMNLRLVRPVLMDTEPESPPYTIVQAISQLTLYRIQEKARDEVSSGDVAKATKHLQYLATHLLSRGERELAHTVLVEANHVKENRTFSSEGEKRIKYGTRALMLPSGPEFPKP